MKDIDKYQQERAEDSTPDDHEKAVVVYSLDIAKKANEVTDYMKKVIEHGKPFDRDDLIEELGDVVWYVSQLAHEKGIKMSEILEANTSKLRARYPNGFNGKLPHWTERVGSGEALAEVSQGPCVDVYEPPELVDCFVVRVNGRWFGSYSAEAWGGRSGAYNAAALKRWKLEQAIAGGASNG